MMFVRPYLCLSETGVHCDHMVHFSADLSLWLDSPMFWASDTKATCRLFPVSPGREMGMDVQTIGEELNTINK